MTALERNFEDTFLGIIGQAHNLGVKNWNPFPGDRYNKMRAIFNVSPALLTKHHGAKTSDQRHTEHMYSSQIRILYIVSNELKSPSGVPPVRHGPEDACVTIASMFRDLPRITPMRLERRTQAFDHPDWIFELKLDGFRALAYINSNECELLSRNGNTFASFRELALALTPEFKGEDGILDGEIVSLDELGHPQFKDLMFRRGELFFVAFDVLWVDGTDLRRRPLEERKRVWQNG